MGRARQHPVFGRDPALAGSAQEGGRAFFEAGSAQHVRIAEFDQARALGMLGNARFKGHAAHLVVGAGRWAHLVCLEVCTLRRYLAALPPKVQTFRRSGKLVSADQDLKALDSVSAQALNKALGERPREVFRHLVEAFLTSGEPVGSRTLSQRLPLALSPASIRNVMADLESMGLLYAPHTSAGRAPTEKGLRLFVDGLLEIGDLAPDERVAIEARMSGSGRAVEDLLSQATQSLAGLSRCAGLMVTAKQDAALKHVEFVGIAPGKALVIMVSEDGQVENRVIDTPIGLPVSALVEAGNYLSARLRGRTIDSARAEIMTELEGERAELDSLTAKIVAEGLATLSQPSSS